MNPLHYFTVKKLLNQVKQILFDIQMCVRANVIEDETGRKHC